MGRPERVGGSRITRGRQKFPPCRRRLARARKAARAGGRRQGFKNPLLGADAPAPDARGSAADARTPLCRPKLPPGTPQPKSANVLHQYIWPSRPKACPTYQNNRRTSPAFPVSSSDTHYLCAPLSSLSLSLETSTNTIAHSKTKGRPFSDSAAAALPPHSNGGRDDSFVFPFS